MSNNNNKNFLCIKNEFLCIKDECYNLKHITSIKCTNDEYGERCTLYGKKYWYSTLEKRGYAYIDIIDRTEKGEPAYDYCKNMLANKF